VAQRDRYFDLLDEYRTGHIEPLELAFSAAARIAAAKARVTAAGLARVATATLRVVSR
jgi:hypothetical protein